MKQSKLLYELPDSKPIVLGSGHHRTVVTYHDEIRTIVAAQGPVWLTQHVWVIFEGGSVHVRSFVDIPDLAPDPAELPELIITIKTMHDTPVAFDQAQGPVTVAGLTMKC